MSKYTLISKTQTIIFINDIRAISIFVTIIQIIRI